MVRLPRDVGTLGQFLRLPEFKPAFEFVDGRVIQKMSPMLPQSILQRELVNILDAFAGPRKLGRAYPELRCTFAGQSIVFDVSFYLAGRLPSIARRKESPRVLTPPDIAVEIISPGQVVREPSRRLQLALQHGSPIGWLIRPRREEVILFRPGSEVEVLRAGDILTGEGVLPDFALAVEDFFGRLDQD